MWVGCWGKHCLVQWYLHCRWSAVGGVKFGDLEITCLGKKSEVQTDGGWYRGWAGGKGSK